MTTTTREDVLQALGRVIDPELGRDLVSLGMISMDYDVIIAGGSFGGLAAAAQLRGRHVLLIEPHTIGSVQTSGCGTLLAVLQATGTLDSLPKPTTASCSTWDRPHLSIPCPIHFAHSTIKPFAIDC